MKDFDFFGIESQLENQEKSVENLENEKQSVELREQNIQKAILQLKEDSKITELLKHNAESATKEKQTVENQINECKEQLKIIQSEIQEMFEETENSQETINVLEALGEDVSDAQDIIEERKILLEEYQEQLQQLAEQLDLQLEEFELDLEKKESNLSEKDTEQISNKTNWKEKGLSFRCPRNGGEYDGEPGNSDWYPNPDVIPGDRHGTNSDHKTWREILQKYGIDKIPFRDGTPDFSAISKGNVSVKYFTTDRNCNFVQADELLAKQRNCTPQEVRKWRRKHKYTWHEDIDCTTMQKVPREVHGNISHIGGISRKKAMEAQYKF